MNEAEPRGRRIYSDSQTALSPGDKLGPYEILAPLGAGGMGEVYKALDTRLRRDVAIKVLPDALTNQPMRERFNRESRAALALNHPNICAIFDVGNPVVGPLLGYCFGGAAQPHECEARACKIGAEKPPSRKLAPKRHTRKPLP